MVLSYSTENVTKGIQKQKTYGRERVVQVGGDGLFQEVLDGVAALRCGVDAQRAAAAAQLRLGHIPGGSTDAAAYSMHGTRSAACAALHAALGDRYAHSHCRLWSAGCGSAQQASSCLIVTNEQLTSAASG